MTAREDSVTRRVRTRRTSSSELIQCALKIVTCFNQTASGGECVLFDLVNLHARDFAFTQFDTPLTVDSNQTDVVLRVDLDLPVSSQQVVILSRELEIECPSESGEVACCVNDVAFRLSQTFEANVVLKDEMCDFE